MWFRAAYLVAMRGVNARRLARTLHLTYKVAWTWCHKLRHAMRGEPMKVWPEELALAEKRPVRLAGIHLHGMLEIKATRPGAPDSADRGGRRLDRRDWQDPLDGKPWPGNEAAPDLDIGATLARRWMLASHRGAISEKHLGAYLVEFAFRFNRRLDRTVAPAERLVELLPRTEPRPYRAITGKPAERERLRLRSQRVVRRKGELVLITPAGRPPPPTEHQRAEDASQDRLERLARLSRGGDKP